MLSALVGAAISEVPDTVVDACTLNNALNAAQLAMLVALVRWVSRDQRDR